MNFGPHFSGFYASFESVVGSGIFRLVQTLLEASPFLMVGVLFAGLMRGMVGRGQVCRVFGGGGFEGAFRGWVLGITLPVCALGALPVARELRKSQVTTGTVLSFVTVAPVMNPISIAYGVSHVDLPTFLAFLAGSFVISVTLGWAWDSRFPHTPDSSKPQRNLTSSMQRLKLSGWSILKSSNLSVAWDLFLVIGFMGFLGAILPYGTLQGLFIKGSFLSPVIMGVFAIPVYITPMEIMTQFEHVVRDGYSLGAAFMLAILGAGANVAVLNWVRRDFGVKTVILLIGFFFCITLGFSYVMEWLPWRSGVSSTDHTHAFDGYSRLPASDLNSLNPDRIWSGVSEEANLTQLAGAGVLVAFFLLSFIMDRVVLRKSGGIDGKMDLLQNQSDGSEVTGGVGEKHVPLPVVFSFGITLAISGAYFFGLVMYDPPELTVTRMGDVRGELTQAILREDFEEIELRLDQMDFLASQLDMGYLLRKFSLPESEIDLPGQFRNRLRVVSEFAHEGDGRAVKNLQGYLHETFRLIQSIYAR